MTSGITYWAVAGTLPEIEALAAEARSEGFQHVSRPAAGEPAPPI